MKLLLCGGSGFVGSYLAKHYLELGHQVTVIGRSVAKIYQRFGDKATAYTWSDLTSELIAEHDLVINLAGAGIANQRWSNARKKTLVDSRILTTRQLVEQCCKLLDKCPPVFNASAVGIYGIQQPLANGLPDAMNEDTPLDCDSPKYFSQSICCQWEAETRPLIAHGIRCVNLRLGVVIGKNGGALQKMLLPFKLGLGGKIASGKQPFAWVSIEDVQRAIDFIFEHKDISGPVNIVAPQGVSQGQFASALAKALHRPAILFTPAFVLKAAFGEMAEELLINGQHVYPKRLVDAGFEFKYTDVGSALQAVI